MPIPLFRRLLSASSSRLGCGLTYRCGVGLNFASVLRRTQTGHRNSFHMALNLQSPQPPNHLSAIINMRLQSLSRGAVLAYLSLLVTQVASTALTYKIAPNEVQCFYTFADKQYSKVAFYFAVSSPRPC